MFVLHPIATTYNTLDNIKVFNLQIFLMYVYNVPMYLKYNRPISPSDFKVFQTHLCQHSKFVLTNFLFLRDFLELRFRRLTFRHLKIQGPLIKLQITNDCLNCEWYPTTKLKWPLSASRENVKIVKSKPGVLLREVFSYYVIS